MTFADPAEERRHDSVAAEEQEAMPAYVPQPAARCCLPFCDDPVWEEWHVPVYSYGFGPSLTRGCFFGWFFLHAPYCCFRAGARIGYRVARNFVSSSGQPTGCGAMLAQWLGFIIHFCLAVVWVLATIVLFFPWLFCYVLFFFIELLLMLVWAVTCGYCSKRPAWIHAGWRSFSCGGWMNDWLITQHPDPYTKEIWDEWSPVRTLCTYNFPPYVPRDV